jgi:hypothetical protein
LILTPIVALPPKLATINFEALAYANWWTTVLFYAAPGLCPASWCEDPGGRSCFGEHHTAKPRLIWLGLRNEVNYRGRQSSTTCPQNLIVFRLLVVCLMWIGDFVLVYYVLGLIFIKFVCLDNFCSKKIEKFRLKLSVF